ncbi:hypothetical protein T484DRAFT_1803008 [Baffinella frigidus]|nr:hypothetical protein T484DRAFT_1803008 [Cryptophyta sp. CCMP2293]|eukprot:CAMPEP_0180288218 /NCGR_PEP_ID=MMETSP0988-20121125/13910_1 /TAXON_ID=697907 /ORGANISM="non described non described, Strain CCMP2293" /LENGTH=172 /DNA_ID=CAMNT_0022262839 /DNA_START=6 /DNA_END=524 /DNA_ORIENTATION=-
MASKCAQCGAEYSGEDTNPAGEPGTCPACLGVAAGAKRAADDDVVDLTDPEVEAAVSKKAKQAEDQALQEKEDDDEDDEDEEEEEEEEDEDEGSPIQVWILAKGDPVDPKNQDDPLPPVSVLGVYSSRVRADKAMQDFLQEGEWIQGGYGYHQGGAESRIEIYSSLVNGAAQ